MDMLKVWFWRSYILGTLLSIVLSVFVSNVLNSNFYGFIAYLLLSFLTIFTTVYVSMRKMEND